MTGVIPRMWHAKTHIIADSAVREVWYLPNGAPPDEIRLLEINEAWEELQSPVGRQFLTLLNRLFAAADAFL